MPQLNVRGALIFLFVQKCCLSCPGRVFWLHIKTFLGLQLQQNTEPSWGNTTNVRAVHGRDLHLFLNVAATLDTLHCGPTSWKSSKHPGNRHGNPEFKGFGTADICFSPFY